MPFYLGCVCTALGTHVLVGTQGISFLYALHPSVPSEPIWYVCISNVFPTLPCRWEVCRGAPTLRRKPVAALPSRMCRWALTHERKRPLFLVVTGLTCGCLSFVMGTDAVVNAEHSWVHALLPKRERSGLSQSWQ